VRRTGRANHTWNSGSARYLFLVDGWHNRSAATDICGTHDTSNIGDLFNVYSRRRSHTIPDAVRAACYLIHDRFSRLDRTGAAAARTTAAAVAFDYCGACTGAIDGHEHSVYVHAEHHGRDDGIGTIDVTDCDGAGSSVGDDSDANRRHHDRKHFANGPAWQLFDHRMQLHARRPADQRRGFAAFDAGHSGKSATRYDSARRRAAWRHQYRSVGGGYSNAEHVGMRRRHDDESGDTRHDGTGQCYGRRGNAGCFAGGLLT
jgi:hypothetical protein